MNYNFKTFGGMIQVNQARRFKSLFLVVVIFGVIISAAPILAEDNTENEVKTKIKIDDQLTVNKLKDGRIEGLKNAGQLKKEQRLAVLSQMKFTENEIKTMSVDLQQNIIANGGVKVESNQTDFKEVYTDLRGKDHVITEENREKIQKLIEKDLSEFKSKTKGNVSTLAMGSAADGIWYGMSYIVYNGINSYNTEYMYDYYTSYTWNGRPGVAFTDTVTQAWQSHTTRVSSSGQHAWQVPAWQNPNQPIYYYPMSINYNSIAGTQATFNLQYVDGTQYGHLKDSVRIPIT